MNLSEHLALFIKRRLNCSTVFTLTGGGAMFLNDAFGNTKDLSCIYTHHEQSAAMAALSYSKISGIGVCVTTTGCGATNALTGLLDAWQDSQPVLFISGQVKKKETTYYSDLALRAFGVQELNIIPIVKSITKKALCVGSKKEYFDALENIEDWLFGERPGPVWLDIPMDLQSEKLTDKESQLFICNDENIVPWNPIYICSSPEKLNELKSTLDKSQKPIFLVGNGLRLSNQGLGINLIEEFCQEHSIPIAATYLAADFFEHQLPNYLGVAGLKSARRANIALYNSDLVVVVGSRLATSVIGFEYNKFAPYANIFVIDIDPVEHSKITRDSMNLVLCDAYYFAKEMHSHKASSLTADNRESWLKNCLEMKHLLPVQEQFSPEDSVSIYDVVFQICENFGDHDFLISDAGSAYYVASIMFEKKSNQRYVTSGAQADMGFSLPAAVGAGVISKALSSRVHAITGDGSFQLNIQEIQTLVTYKLPVTIYILNNRGYLSIRATQNSFFPGRQCGTDPSNGVEFPNLSILCDAYDIAYRYSESVNSLIDVVCESNLSDYPIICEIKCPENEAIIPRTKTIKKDDGTLESSPLCKMLPDLPPDIIDKLINMGFIC